MNKIHSTALLSPDVQLGDGNEILPYTVLQGPLTLGNDNIIGPHVVIGTPRGDTREPRYDSSGSPICIGDSNIIREFCAVQKSVYGEETTMGSHVFLMQSVHVPHDALIEDQVVVTPLVSIGGSAKILQGANLGIEPPWV